MANIEESKLDDKFSTRTNNGMNLKLTFSANEPLLLLPQ